MNDEQSSCGCETRINNCTISEAIVQDLNLISDHNIHDKMHEQANLSEVNMGNRGWNCVSSDNKGTRSMCEDMEDENFTYQTPSIKEGHDQIVM